MSDKQVATSESRTTLASIVDRPEYRKRFGDVLGERAPQFISSLLSVSNASHLYDAEPRSIVAAAMVAASLDLPINPNLGFAHIVPYKQDGVKIAQFQMGYKGFVQLAMRTGQYRFINACIVYAGELIKYDKLTGELLLKSDLADIARGPEDRPIGYASYFRTLNGFEHALYMTREQCEAHGKRYSQSFKKGYGLWKDDFDAMALKTVIKLNLSRWGVLSVQMERALFEDQGMRLDINTDPMFPDNGARPQIERPKIGPGPTTAEEKPSDKKLKPIKAKKPAEASANALLVDGLLKAAGATTVDLLRVAIQKEWIDPPDADLNTVELASIEEDKLQAILDIWPDVAEAIDALKSKKPGSELPFA